LTATDPAPGSAAPRPKSIGLAPGLDDAAAGQDAAKYGTTNPVVQKLLARWMGVLQGVLGPAEAAGTIVDIGTGEGFALERMFPAGPAAIGLEYRHDKAVVASEKLTALSVVRGDAGVLPFPDRSADLVTSIEVLEHLPGFEQAVAEMARITRGRLVVSVPWEPWFRLGNLGRGKNVKRMGNDPEHVNFFNPRKLKAALGLHFTEVKVIKAFPWIIAEASQPK
jgi:SAM-dependent methyltransferase